jgi:hypothetical protein
LSVVTREGWPSRLHLAPVNALAYCLVCRLSPAYCRAWGGDNDHVFVPFGQGDIDFATFFHRIGKSRQRIAFWEQDNAPGGAANPGQPLEFAEISYPPLRILRKRGRKDDDQRAPGLGVMWEPVR